MYFLFINYSYNLDSNNSLKIFFGNYMFTFIIKKSNKDIFLLTYLYKFKFIKSKFEKCW